MAEPDDIVEAALALVGRRGLGDGPTREDLAGRRILVTAGGTREPLDPVRFIGNRSSGRQGVAIARMAAARGAEVVLIAAHLDIDDPAGIEVRHVGTALELQEATLLAAGTADVVIMAAAVADYRPDHVADRKIKKDEQGDVLELRLVRNPDILRELAANRSDGQLVIGFAAETEPDREALLALARTKAERKGVDYLVVNRVGWNEGFATEGNEVIVLDKSGDIVAEASGSKASVADRILDLAR